MKIGVFILLAGAVGARALAVAGEPTSTLRILALDRPQLAAEQKLAASVFSPQSGIRVDFDKCSASELKARLDRVVASRDSRYDLIHYEAHWLGELVDSNALERLDTPDRLGTNTASVLLEEGLGERAWLLAATNTVLTFSVLRPDVAIRVGKYPTRDGNLAARRFEAYNLTPVYGLPWATGSQILIWRTDLVEGAFASVPSAVAAHYRELVAPNWRNEWRYFTSAAGLVQIVHPKIRAVAVRGRAEGGAILQDFLPILWAFGGSLWNESEWAVLGVLNSETNRKALQYFCEWYAPRKVVPEASLHWGTEEAARALARGEVAMAFLPSYYALRMDDPKQSTVAGRLGYAPLPGVSAVAVQRRPTEAGTSALDSLKKLEAHRFTRRAALADCVGVGIHSASSRKTEAWRYLEWLLSRETQLALLFEPGSGFVSARQDLWAESRRLSPWHEAATQQFDLGAVRSRWNMAEAPAAEAILARECSLAFRGEKSPQAALDDAARQIQQLFDGEPVVATP